LEDPAADRERHPRTTTGGNALSDRQALATNSIQIRAVTDFKRQQIKPKPSH